MVTKAVLEFVRSSFIFEHSDGTAEIGYFIIYRLLVRVQPPFRSSSIGRAISLSITDFDFVRLFDSGYFQMVLQRSATSTFNRALSVRIRLNRKIDGVIGNTLCHFSILSIWSYFCYKAELQKRVTSKDYKL